MRIALLAVCLGAATVAPRPATACDAVDYWTPLDLADQAATVVVAKVVSVPSKLPGQVLLEVEQTLKGLTKSTWTVRDDGSDCDATFQAGGRGVLFLDAAHNPVGLYDAFSSPLWVPLLTTYLSSATASERAAAVVEVAVSTDWTRSFQAALALADRPELIVAIRPDDRTRVFTRLAKATRTHPLWDLATRLHDPRLAELSKRRGVRFKNLAAVARSEFLQVVDVNVVADILAAPREPLYRRIGAFERCELLHGRTLGRFFRYKGPDDGRWASRADACRSGTREPGARPPD